MSAAAVRELKVAASALAEPMRQSLPCDQGKELSRHKDLTARTSVAVYLCDPHSPCENTNGLLRRYLPKGPRART